MQFQMVKTAALTPSPLNPRKHFDQARLEELAASMGHDVGLIEPIVARAGRTPETFEIIAGERRWKAAQLAQLAEVPVIVKVLTDKQVIDLMLIENGQREDLNPLEEGEGYKQALKIGAFKDVDALATHVGKSRRHVYDSLKLVDDLIPAAKDLLNDGRITASHAVPLSRLARDQQQRAIDPVHGGLFDWEDVQGLERPDDLPTPPAKRDPLAGRRTTSVREFESWINEHVKLDLKSPKLREQFPEAAQAVAAAADAVVRITHESYLYGVVEKKDADRIYLSQDWRRADGLRGSTVCPAAVMGVVVVGAGRGDAFKVCVEKKCDIHWKKVARPSSSAPRAGAAASSSKALVKRQAAERKRLEAARQKVEAARATWKTAIPLIARALAVKIQTAKPPALLALLLENEAFYDVRELAPAAAALLPKKSDAATILSTITLAALIHESHDCLTSWPPLRPTRAAGSGRRGNLSAAARRVGRVSRNGRVRPFGARCLRATRTPAWRAAAPSTRTRSTNCGAPIPITSSHARSPRRRSRTRPRTSVRSVRPAMRILDRRRSLSPAMPTSD